MMKHLFRIFMSAVLLVLCTNLNAQVTTSSITGIVTDAQTKDPLIGATVIVTHVPTGSVYGATSNTAGVYNIQGLRPGGPYTIKVSYVGYQTKVFKNVALNLGEPLTLNIWLKDDSKALQQVVITADRSASFNSQRTGAASNFSLQQIDRTPSVSRSIFDIAKLTPQANTSGSGTSFGGASNKYNSFQIDGTVNNDVFGLSSSGTNGGQTGANPISLEAIQAVQVVIAPFDVRQSGFTGGGINAITKSGTNEFHGSGYTFFNNQDLVGTTPGPLAPGAKRQKYGTQSDKTYGFTFGGPIKKDKLFFFINGEYTNASYPSSYNIGQGSNITVDEATKVADKLKSLTGGYDGGGFAPLTIPTTSYKALARLDWNIAQGHRLTLRYSFLNANKLIYGNSANVFEFGDSGYHIIDQTHSIVAELNSRFNNSLSNEFRFGYTRVRDHREIGSHPFPHVQIKLDNNRSIIVGADQYSQANRLDQDVFTLSDNLSYTVGDHIFTVGTDNQFYDVKNLFIRDLFGSYQYSSLNDFLSIGTSSESMPYQYDYSHSIVEGQPLWAASFKSMQLGFYAQDEWRVNSKLKLTYGIRMDLPLFLDTPTANTKFNDSQIAMDDNIQNNTMPKVSPLWSPRIGFRYDPSESHRFIIRGGVGIFTGRIPFVWVANSFSNTGLQFARTRIKGKFPSDFKFQKDINNPYSPSKVFTSEIDLVRKDFKYPQVAKFNLAFDLVLPGNVKATLEGMFSKNLNDIRYTNALNTVTDKPIIEGDLRRPTFRPLTRDYYAIIVLGNTHKGYSYNLTAQLSKSFAFGLNASLAYTLGHSYGIQDGGSSQAYSNWQYNYTYYGDAKEVLYHTNYDLGQRIVGTLNYHIDYGKYFGTTIGLVYNGQTGNRFSMVYYGDLNGDGSSGNDLTYIPTKAELDKIANMPQDQKDAFMNFIMNNPQITNFRGTYIPRNGLVLPFVNQVDLHFAQDFYIKVGGKRHTLELNADILNVGNLLNRNWGLSYFVKYNNITPVGYKKGNYSFYTPKSLWSMSDYSSRWRAQIGLKYKF